MSSRLPAVVLAGAPADPELRARYSVEYRPAVPIAGRTMLQRVVDALSASSHVGDICVIGNCDCAGVTVVPPRGDFVENLLAGVEACSGAERMLVTTSDIPMLTTEAVDDFVRRCEAVDADFYYPIVERQASERRFPGLPRTYARLAEGSFTGGNIVVLNERFVVDNAESLREVLQARKSVARVARLLGIGVLLRATVAQVVWPGAVTLEWLENVAGRVLNARVKAVRTPFPEIAADVDRPQDIEIVERHCLAEGDSR